MSVGKSLQDDLSAPDGSGLVGHQFGLPGSVARTVQDKLGDVVTIKDFGAACDGIHDDTDAINRALASGVSRLRFVGTCLVSKTLFYPSDIVIEFDHGASVIPVPLDEFQKLDLNGLDWGYAIFMNVNWQAATITDSHASFINPRCTPTSAWDGHFISARMFGNLQVIGSYCTNMADVVSSMACRDVIVRDGWCQAISNCAYDFWEGPTRISVLNCTGYDVNAGVNFNGTDTGVVLGLVADTLQVDGCRFFGCPAGGIYVAPLNAASTCTHIKITNNLIDQAGGVVGTPSGASWNGITVLRSTAVEIRSNTLSRIPYTAAPLIVGLDPAGYGHTAYVTDNTILGSAIGSTAYIQVYGAHSKVENNRAIGSTAEGGYGIAVNSPTTVVGPNDMAGASTYVANQNQGGGATPPALQWEQDSANGEWRYRQPLKAPSVRQDASYALVATGTDLATALALTGPYSFVSAGDPNAGVVLPANAGRTGEEWVVWNYTGNILIVYAAAGDTISGSASLALSHGEKMRLVAITPTLWIIA
ncbi:hypothetical protein [Dyella sp. 2RAB6]|uniref:hypothetical protein n=1 Tax=Dyella sp. 2RAB6 TaxID=3232992 RepID=UPI003F932C51